MRFDFRARPLLPALVAAVLGLTACSPRKGCTFTSGWSTVDDFTKDGLTSSGSELTVDAAGTLYAVGSAGGAWTVRRGLGAGEQWKTLDSLSVASLPYAVVTTSSQILVGGKTEPVPARWLVRSSSDKGDSWSVSESLSVASTVRGMLVSSQGTIFAAGTSGVSPAVWLVKSSSDGLTWTSLDSFSSGTLSYSAMDIAQAPDGALYVVGQGETGSTPASAWFVRRSTDGGGNWTTVDTYAPAGTATNRALGVAVASNGTVYVVGTSEGTDNSTRWVVRKSADGSSFSNTDDYQLATGKNAVPGKPVVDSNGNLNVAGTATDSDGKTHWIVRRTSDGGSSWTNVDDYQTAAGTNAGAQAVRKDAEGNLYAIGSAQASGSTAYHWIVRRQSCR